MPDKPSPNPPIPPTWYVGSGWPDQMPSDLDAICLVFSRDEVCGLRVGRAVDDLMRLSEDAQLRQALAHRLFFSFEGWDQDPREVHAIPECRRYLHALNAQWPYWLHFLAPEPAMWGVLLLTLLEGPHAGGHAEHRDAGQSTHGVNMNPVHELMEAMLRPMNALHADMALTRLQSDAIFTRSMAAVQSVLRGPT